MAKDSTKQKSATSQDAPAPPPFRAAETPKQDAPTVQTPYLAVRSPLFSRGAKPVPESPNLQVVKTTPPPHLKPNGNSPASLSAPSSGNSAQPGPSGIEGLDDPLLETREVREFVPIQHFMFDGSRYLFRKIIYVLLILGTVSLVATVVFWPGFDVRVSDALDRTKVWLAPLASKLGLKSLTEIKTSKRIGPSLKIGQGEPSPTRGRGQKLLLNRSCYDVIHSYPSASKPSVALRIATAECYLQRLDAQSALRVLTPLTEAIQKIPESALNEMNAHHTLADAYHLMGMARVHSHRFQEATEFTKNHCRRWKLTNTCVTKLSLYTAHNLTVPPDVEDLLKTPSRLDPHSQGRLWLASALYSQKQGLLDTAFRRYSSAMDTAPQSNALLRREIYEAYSVYLYKTGAFAKMRSIAKQGLIELKSLEAQSLAKLRFFSQLGALGDQTRFLRSVLGRAEIQAFSQYDSSTLHVVGIESLKHGLTNELQRFLAGLGDFYSTQDEGYTNEKRALTNWMVRLHLYKGENQLALKKLAELASIRNLDATERHLRGVAYAQDSSIPRVQRLAADEFSLALSLRNQPESELALGFALLRSGKPADTADVIRRLETKIIQGNLKFWLDMLKAEWSLVSGKLENAEKICRLWAKNKPFFQTPVKLQIEILTKMGNTPGAQSLREELDSPELGQLGHQSEEILSSPLSPFSLADRSL